MRQRGAALLALTLLVALLAGVMVVDWTLAQSRQRLASLELDQSEYLAALESAITHWYALNAPSIDAVPQAPEWRRAMRETGSIERWNVQVAFSQRLARDGVSYRNIALWLPKDAADSTRFDAATGTLTVAAGTASRTISGFSIQSQAVAETRARLQTIAQRLEAHATTQYLLDPSRNQLVNRFRAIDCANPHVTELPCVDTYQRIESTGVAASVGLEPQLMTDAWGQSIEVSNGMDSQTTEPPYSMALRATTPWGAVIRVIPVQAL